MKKVRWCAVLVLTAAALGAAAAGEENVVFREPFDGRLADGWSWVREDPKGWKIDQGALVVHTSTGGLWMKDNNATNILLRAPDAKDAYAFEALVENEPTNAYEHAGLVWYVGDDDYVVLNKEKVGARQVVQLVFEKEGKPKVGFAEKPYDGKAVWLRMEVADGKAVGKYRATDKDDWQTLGQCDLPAKGDARVGLLTGYGAKDSDHTSRLSVISGF